MPWVGRRTERGVPRYGDEDTFVLSGADDLVPVAPTPGRERLTEDGRTFRVDRYRPRSEHDFARIERWTDLASGDQRWVVGTREGVVHRFGTGPGARIADPTDPRRLFRWLLESSEDAMGNRIAYEYRPEDRDGVDSASMGERNRAADAQRYLAAVRYGNAPAAAGGGFRFAVVLDYGGHGEAIEEVRPWAPRADAFSSFRAGFEIRTRRLCRRLLLFHDFPELGPEPTLVRSLDLAYDERPHLSLLVSVTETGYAREPGGGYRQRRLSPLQFTYTEPRTSDAVRDMEGVENLPAGVDGPAHQWVDLDAEGIAGVLRAEPGAWRYLPNLGGGRLGPAALVAALPGGAEAARPAIVDLAGDGGRSLVEWEGPLAGFSERTAEGGWEPWTPFAAMPAIDWSDPQLRLLDLDGDGVADILITRDDAFAVHRSLGREGFAERDTVAVPLDEEAGPRLVFADGTTTVFVADMNGDGLPDLVRVTAAEVAYWPNAGHGRFGPRVAMDAAPVLDQPDVFRPERVRLADIDGTGTADLVYLGRDRVRCWANLAGNGWGPTRELAAFPDTDSLESVAVLDLLGQGTACLVWSSPAPRDRGRPLRYVDLCGGKPHLLASVVNNLGAETHVSYAPSTRLYLEDRAAGIEWATRPPFPVQVVERVETVELVTGARLVSRYRYRHGYYDRPERELRGFGLVEQLDAETFDRSADPALQLPPVRTRTWYHTGALLAEKSLLRSYEREQFSGDRLETGPALALDPDPAAWSPEGVRDAHRALRGAVLRREVCALDGTPRAEVPYVVEAATYTVRRLEPGVCFAHPRSRVTAAYERRADDPRVTQTLALEIDDHGNVTRSASAGLARRAPELAEQARTLTTVTESTFFNADPAAPRHRAGVPAGSATYELTGLPALTRPLTPADLTGARRLVARERQQYWRDDLSGPLPPGQVGSRALPHRSYRLALTADLVAAAYGTRVGPDLLREAGHVDLEGDGSWWAPSDILVPDPDRFYQPAAREDPFGVRITVSYDRDALLVVEAVDALGSRTRFTNDYRTLAPAAVTDVNGNVSAVATDELGRVVAAAVGGPPGSDQGQTLDDPTRTFAYDLERLPALVHGRERETDRPDTRWRETYAYSDGLGRLAQTKASAPPGPAGEPRWLATGRTVYDNKGNPVRRHEPYFSTTPAYDRDDAAAAGVAVVTHHDPLGRRVREDLPDGSFSRVELGAWLQASWDRNDTVLESDWLAAARASASPALRRAADLAAAHAGTPAVVHLDPFGRTVLSVADDGPDGRFETRHQLDVQGNLLSVVDANGAVAERSRYDLLGRRVLTRSADAGLRWTVFDVAGQPVLSGDGREVVTRTRYDALRRPVERRVAVGGGPERLVERTIHGEHHPEAEARNLRGRVFQVLHQAGVTTRERYDLRGGLVLERHQVCADAAADPDWSSAPALDPETLAIATDYDTLGRAVRVVTQDGSERLVTHDEAGLPSRIGVRLRGAPDATPIVERIEYDARGQRTLVELGSGVETRFERDRRTFRLDRLLTRRGGTVLQDVRHTYDPVGNVTQFDDAAQQAVFFDGAVVPPGSTYEYDAVYRIRAAGGREHAAAVAAQPDERDPWTSLPDPRDGSALVAYTETFGYDPAGNLRWVQHRTPNGGWQRRYDYEPGSNRLAATSLPGDPPGQLSARYSHDEAGNVTAMPHLPRLDWDHAGRLRRADLAGGGRLTLAYDAAGARVRRIIESGGLVEERLTFGSYEVWRRRTARGVVAERQTLQVGDAHGLHALVETVTVEDGGPLAGPAPLVRYQHGDHLGSVRLETDERGRLVSYEEYHPYGSTAYQAPRARLEASPKRFRFTGMERDEGTGLNHHGARYYATWLGRWIAPDPAGPVDGTNRYVYASDNPVRLRDASGLVPTPEEVEQVTEQAREQARVERGYLQRIRAAEAELRQLDLRQREISARLLALERRTGEVAEVASRQLGEEVLRGAEEIQAANRRLAALERGAELEVARGRQLAARGQALLEAARATEFPPPPPAAPGEAGPYRTPGTIDPPAALRGALSELGGATEALETTLRPPPPPPPRGGGGGGGGRPGGGAAPGQGTPPAEPSPPAAARSASEARWAARSAAATRAAGILGMIGMLWQGLLWEYTSRRFGYIEYGGLRVYNSWGAVPEGSRVRNEQGYTGRKIGGRFVEDPL